MMMDSFPFIDPFGLDLKLDILFSFVIFVIHFLKSLKIENIHHEFRDESIVFLNSFNHCDAVVSWLQELLILIVRTH